MIKLTDAQKGLLMEWTAAGATVAELQKRMGEEWGIRMTYLDTRMLAADLALALKDKPKEAPAKESHLNPGQGSQTSVDGQTTAPDSVPAQGEWEVPDPAAKGEDSLKIEVDKVPPPTALVSGKATFSDGKFIVWYVDQMGRLGLRQGTPGFQPTEPQLMKFDQELSAVLQKYGY